MASAAFNAFQAARALESAGVERTQAEAIARAIQQGHNQDQATRGDVAELGCQLRTKIAEFGAEVRAVRGEHRMGLAAFEKRMTVRLYVGGAWLAAWIIAFELFA